MWKSLWPLLMRRYHNFQISQLSFWETRTIMKKNPISISMIYKIQRHLGWISRFQFQLFYYRTVHAFFTMLSKYNISDGCWKHSQCFLSKLPLGSLQSFIDFPPPIQYSPLWLGMQSCHCRKIIMTSLKQYYDFIGMGTSEKSCMHKSTLWRIIKNIRTSPDRI